MLERHCLVWLEEKGWQQFEQGVAHQPIVIRDAIARWHAANWPLVVCRPKTVIGIEEIALGISLPPQPITGSSLRIGAVVERHRIARHAPALPLSEVCINLPTEWRADCVAMLLETMDHLPPLRVFGSLSWQTSTSMKYLHDQSDIDLLFQPLSLEQLRFGCDLLERYAQRLPLDGEIIFPNGQAVAWREWNSVRQSAGRHAKVMAKHITGVSLVGCDVLLDGLA